MMYKPPLNRTESRTLAATAADPTSTRDLTNSGHAQVAQIDANASTTIGKLSGGDVGLAFGGEIVGLSNSSADGERKVSSAFVEVRTPFTKTFEMDFAGRVDKYPNLKTSFVPKVGAKWTLSPQVTLRSTYAEGFRAPPSSNDTACAIWNPSAAATWSLVFTPAFGAFIHMRNWQAVGQPQLAASARRWFYASLSLLMLQVLTRALNTRLGS